MLLAALAVPLLSGTAMAAPDPAVAALQVTLSARGLYGGPIDGVRGPATSVGIRVAQRRAELQVDGVVGPQTRRALALRELGSRLLETGSSGADVSALQFALSLHGFTCGTIDGAFGRRTAAALRRFQRSTGLNGDGVAGPATVAALRMSPQAVPLPLAWPLDGPLTGTFGPRGQRFHPGIDIAAEAGTPVGAAAGGRVAYAGWRDGGWGMMVTIAHGRTRTVYAHLSRVDVHVGDLVTGGRTVGLVGATGNATGPHLHFEVRVGGAALDPLPGFVR